MQILIAGAGIGGLAAAIGLRRAGHAVHLIEQSAELQPVGSGISLHSNAMEALRRLGVADAVARRGGPLLRGTVARSDGRVLQSQDLRALTEPLHQPDGVAIHRGILQEILLEAATGPGPGPAATLSLGRRVSRIEHDADSVSLDIGEERVNAELVIGADGIHSVVAGAIRGPRTPRYAGYTAWRGLADSAAAGLEPGVGVEMNGRGQRLGAIPLGEGLTYWFCTANAPPGGSEGSAEAELALVSRRFGAWGGPAPALLAATSPQAFLRNDILDHPFDPRWGEGRLTLLGDAAHAMTPNMGQGAAQAIEDAVVLAHCLATLPSPTEALRTYEQLRRPRAAWFVQTSWRIGQMGQLSNPAAVWLRDLLSGIPGAPVFVRPGLRRMLRFPYPDALAEPPPALPGPGPTPDGSASERPHPGR